MSFATISSKLIACSIGACRRQKSWMSGSLPPRVNCSARFRSVIYGTAAAGRVVKLVKLPAFRPYTRARAQPRITPQKYRSSPTSPRGVGWTLHPHETCGKQHAMPCHHALAEALGACIDTGGTVADRKGWLFRTGARGIMGVLYPTRP
jgi:hypothetical protein